MVSKPGENEFFTQLNNFKSISESNNQICGQVVLINY